MPKPTKADKQRLIEKILDFKVEIERFKLDKKVSKK